ncbi:hypothetical protein D9M68_1003420 [compost metagenome]
MPVVLASEQFDLWLAPDTTDEQVQRAMATARSDFVGRAVSTRVNDVRNDDEGLIEGVAEPPS